MPMRCPKCNHYMATCVCIQPYRIPRVDTHETQPSEEQRRPNQRRNPKQAIPGRLRRS